MNPISRRQFVHQTAFAAAVPYARPIKKLDRRLDQRSGITVRHVSFPRGLFRHPRSPLLLVEKSAA